MNSATRSATRLKPSQDTSLDVNLQNIQNLPNLHDLHNLHRHRLSNLTTTTRLSPGRAVLRAVVFLVILMGLAPSVASAAPVNLVINGQRVEVSPAPFIVDGRTVAPVRAVSENLGATVGWNDQTRIVTVSRDDRLLRLRIDNRLVDVRRGLAGGANGAGQDPAQDVTSSAILSDVPPRIYQDRTFIPLRLAATSLGLSVRWDGATRTVFIDSADTVTGALNSPVAITSPRSGQVISGLTDLQVAIVDKLPVGAAEVRFLLLDPETGRGPVVARGSITGTHRLQVDPAYNGARFLAAVIYDEAGGFLTGDAIPVQVSVLPQVSLNGAAPNQVVSGNITLTARANFPAAYVRYEILNPETGEVRELTKIDPLGQFVWRPRLTDNGKRIIRVAAGDRLGNTHPGAAVSVTVAVERHLALTGVSAGATLDGPVNLGISSNFPARETMFLLRDPTTGYYEVLARVEGASGYRWFPTPDQAGRRELLAAVTDQQGYTHRTGLVPINVAGTGRLVLETVGPNQVLTGEVKLRSWANIPLARIEYVLSNPQTGAERLIISGTDPGATYTWKPGPNDAGPWQLFSRGTGPAGEKLLSKTIPVRVYTGPLYGPRPAIERDRFLAFTTEHALRSQALTGMSAALQVAQAILESAWGQSSPVDKYTGQPSYNLFGIKGTGPAGSVISNTWEEYNGIVYRVDAPFRAYRNPAESWDDHKRLLLTSGRYEPFRAVMHDSTQGAWALKRAGYATDSQYPLKLIDLVRRYDLYHLDELAP